MLIETLFPGCTIGRGGNEANGLSADVLPQNCKIVDHFHNGYHPVDELREHYLVAMNDTLTTVYLRICAAGCGADYEAFAYIMDTGIGAEMQFYRMKESFENV